VADASSSRAKVSASAGALAERILIRTEPKIRFIAASSRNLSPRFRAERNIPERRGGCLSESD
jgi:hypothetical protein